LGPVRARIHDIIGLQIAVIYASGMGLCKSMTSRQNYGIDSPVSLKYIFLFKFAIHVISERTTAKIFHSIPRAKIRRIPTNVPLDDLYYVRMIELS
jgi:hypothetical protein